MIGFGKGVVFGFVIVLIVCYFGLCVKFNIESLLVNMTSVVVMVIIMVIFVDVVFVIFICNIGVLNLWMS